MWSAEPQRITTGAEDPFRKSISRAISIAVRNSSSGGSPESRAIEAASKTVAAWHERGLLRTATEVYHTHDQCADDSDRADKETRSLRGHRMTAPTQYNGKPIIPGTWMARCANVLAEQADRMRARESMSAELSDEKIWYEWGYRLSSGECVWGEDFGRDGSWTPARPDLGVGNIDLYQGGEYVAIRAELDRAGLIDADVVRRRVTEKRDKPEAVIN